MNLEIPTKDCESQMATINLTKNDFEETVTAEGTVFVDFWASWCGPCRSFAPVFEKVSDDNTDAVFAKIDTEAEQELAGALGIQSIPTLMAFRDGILVFSQPGALPEAAFAELVGKVGDLDMDEVRASIEAAQAAEAAAQTGEVAE